jgi:hypothetical protein
VSETVSPLEAAVAALLASLPEIQIAGLTHASDDEISLFHYCTGPRLEETFGLNADSPLAQAFRAEGISTPAGMSFILLLELRATCRKPRIVVG